MKSLVFWLAIVVWLGVSLYMTQQDLAALAFSGFAAAAFIWFINAVIVGVVVVLVAGFVYFLLVLLGFGE
jgi:hypothetical protein